MSSGTHGMMLGLATWCWLASTPGCCRHDEHSLTNSVSLSEGLRLSGEASAGALPVQGTTGHVEGTSYPVCKISYSDFARAQSKLNAFASAVPNMSSSELLENFEFFRLVGTNESGFEDFYLEGGKNWIISEEMKRRGAEARDALKMHLQDHRTILCGPQGPAITLGAFCSHLLQASDPDGNRTNHCYWGFSRPWYNPSFSVVWP